MQFLSSCHEDNAPSYERVETQSMRFRLNAANDAMSIYNFEETPRHAPLSWQHATLCRLEAGPLMYRRHWLLLIAI
jgi:hypothetical protein